MGPPDPQQSGVCVGDVSASGDGGIVGGDSACASGDGVSVSGDVGSVGGDSYSVCTITGVDGRSVGACVSGDSENAVCSSGNGGSSVGCDGGSVSGEGEKALPTDPDKVPKGDDSMGPKSHPTRSVQGPIQKSIGTLDPPDDETARESTGGVGTHETFFRDEELTECVSALCYGNDEAVLPHEAIHPKDSDTYVYVVGMQPYISRDTLPELEKAEYVTGMLPLMR